MARAVHLEPLHRGLWTARDPAFLPEGALVDATNARYKPGDVALYQAEGRTSVGVSVGESYGGAGLVWDKGSRAVIGVEELFQVLYVDPTTENQLATREARNFGQPRSYLGLEGKLEDVVSEGHWEAVAMSDRVNGDLLNWFVLSGGAVRKNRNLVMIRGEAAAETARRQVFGTLNPSFGAAPIIRWESATGDQLVSYGWDAFMLFATASTLSFGMGGKYTRLEFPYRGISPASKGPHVWEYWSPSLNTWRTLSTTNATIFQTYQGLVSWTAPDDWGPGTYKDVTGRTLGAAFPTQWRDDLFFWVRARPTVNNSAFALVQAPVGYLEVNVTNRDDQRFIAHGLPSVDWTASTLTGAATAGAGLTVGKRYEYWWVWADEFNNHEGSTTEQVDVLISSGATAQITLTWTLQGMVIPMGVTHVHFYRGEATDGADGSVGHAFPTGKRVYSANVKDLVFGAAMTLVDDGSTITSTVSGTQSLSTMGQEFPAAAVVDPVTGAVITSPRNGPPPSASTGDVYQETLVLNDLADPRKIRFSYPGQPHAFPRLNYINLETKDSDRVVAIRSLGNVCGVIAANSVWRLNWLPRESDVDPSRGELLSWVMGYGALDASAVTVFSPPGQQLMLAIAGQTGLYMTNLYEWQEMVPQFNWTRIGTSKKILLNNPQQYRLELYVPAQKEVWYIHYHPSLLAEGSFPITGPMRRPGGLRDAFYLQEADAEGKVISAAGATWYEEGQGETDAGEKLALRAETREMYLGGMGNEFKINRLLVHTRESWIFNPIAIVTYSGPSDPQPLTLLRTGPRRLEMPWVLGKAEFVQFKLQSAVDADFGLAVTTIGVEAESLGKREVS